jgi:hypothetical protein
MKFLPQNLQKQNKIHLIGAAYRIVHFGLSQVAELRPNCTKAANRRSKLRILSGRAAHYDGVFPVRPCENKLKHK